MRSTALLAVLLVAPRASAVQLILHYEALQRILAAQMFTHDGRNYVRGSKNDRCRYAYLENPQIGAEKTRLRIHARFSGRSALDLLGRCIGLGDSFDITILATPYHKDGAIAFRDVEVSSNGREGMYIRGVRRALAQSLEREFTYPLRAEARKMLEQSNGELYRQEMLQFDVADIHVTPYALVLLVDFSIAVK